MNNNYNNNLVAKFEINITNFDVKLTISTIDIKIVRRKKETMKRFRGIEPTINDF